MVAVENTLGHVRPSGWRAISRNINIMGRRCHHVILQDGGLSEASPPAFERQLVTRFGSRPKGQ